MNQCVNGVVAFGLNGVEFCTIVMIAIIALGVAMVWYLNKDIGETKEERFFRKNPFLAIDLGMVPYKNRHNR